VMLDSRRFAGDAATHTSITPATEAASMPQ